VPAHCTAKTWPRFTAKIVPTPGCHYWVGAPADDGHGRFTANGRTVRASQFLWTAHHRPLPPQVVVLHQSCDEPSCTRPDHLRAGEPDREPGQRRQPGPDRGGGGTPAARTGVPMAGRSRAIGSALTAGYDPQRLQAALDAGDPRAHWAVLF